MRFTIVHRDKCAIRFLGAIVFKTRCEGGVMKYVMKSSRNSLILGTRAKRPSRQPGYIERLEQRTLFTVVIVNPTPQPVTMFGTGLDAMGNLLAPGATDPHYTLANSPVGFEPAVVATSPVAPHWDATTATSQWISYTANPGSVGQTGSYDYRTAIDLTGFAPSTLHVTGNLEVDDTGAQVLINQVNIVNPGWAFGTYTAQQPFQIKGGAQTGMNNLDFLVKNSYGATGLQVSMSGTAFPAQGNGVVTLDGVEGQSTGVATLATFGFTDFAHALNSYSATIDWGDGSAPDNSAVIVDNHNGTYSVQATHVWLEETDPSPGTVTVTIHHAGDPDVAATDNSYVSDPSVVASPVPTVKTVAWEDIGPLTLATFTDPGGPEVVGDYSATVDWGDGSGVDTTTPFIVKNGGVYSVEADHVYATDSGGVALTAVVTISHETSAPVVVDQPILVGPPALAGVTLPTFTEGVSTGNVTVATFYGAAVAPVGNFTASIDWGDGKVTPGVVAVSTTNPQIYTVTGSDTYVEEGSYAVKVSVTETAGPTATGMDSAIVADAPLISPMGFPISSQEGTPFSGEVATFVDSYAGNPNAATDYSAVIKWGDGSSSAGVIRPTATPDLYEVDGTHNYQEDGKYSVSVAIADVGGAKTTATTTATITEAPIVVSGVATITVALGSPITNALVATFTDADTLEPLSQYSATIKWGDGKTSTGTVHGSAGNFTVTASHTYTAADIYSAVISVFDGNEFAASGTTGINVVGPNISPSGVTFKGAEGRVFTGSVAKFTSSTSATSGQFSASIAWGDSTTSAGSIVSDGGGKFHVTGSHAYSEENPSGYAVKVSIKNGSKTVIASSLGQIADSPLDSIVGKTITLPVNTTGSNLLLGSFRDQDSLNTDGGDYVGTISWGDGTKSSAGFAFSGSTFNVGSFWQVKGSHKYSTKKTYAVTISLEDTGNPSVLYKMTTTIKVV
jgi:hypothetical protein